jgi:hypothetical protein
MVPKISILVCLQKKKRQMILWQQPVPEESEDYSETAHSQHIGQPVVALSSFAWTIKALKESPRHRKKQKNFEHRGNGSLDDTVNTAGM